MQCRQGLQGPRDLCEWHVHGAGGRERRVATRRNGRSRATGPVGGRRPSARLPGLSAFFVLWTAFACGASAEGESCDLTNRDADCEDGLVCLPAHAVRAVEAVCCPRP